MKKKNILFFTILSLLVGSLNCQTFITPNSLPGLKIWINGDSVKTSSFPIIDTCYDLSPSNNHSFQLNSAWKPIVVQNVLNSHSVIRFDGSNDFINFNDISTIRTIFWVIKEAPGTTLSYRGLLGHNTAYDFFRSTYAFWDPSFSNIFVRNGLTRLNGDSVNGTITNIPAQYSIVSLRTTGPVAANNFTVDRFDIGRVWNGDLAELIIYDNPLTNLQIQQIENYLEQKYAPPITLPADITFTNSICDTTIVPQGANGQFNFHWSTGATTPTISVNKSGKYWVNATNVFGNISSDTIVVTYPYNTIKDSSFCQGNSITWNTNLPKNQFTFLWSNGSTDSLLVINQTGQYHVKITDGFGCLVESDTIIANVDNFPTLASLGPDVNLCSGNAIYLKTGNQPGLTYTWNDGTQNDSLYINTSGQYSTIITNTNNCVAKDTINVTIIGQAPTAAFINSAACKNNSVSFTDNSVPPSGNTISSWLWNFGDGTTLADTSIIQNPFYTYTDTGNYQIHLSITTNAGCKQTAIKNIHVAPKPVANFNNIISCQNDSALFTNLSTSSSAYVPLSYSWNFGDPASGFANTSTLTNPKHSFSQQINYVVKLVTTNNAGCKDSLSKNILVKAEVTADFTYTSPCTNVPVIFQDNSVVPAPNNLNTRLWTIGTSTISGLSVTRSFPSAGLYSVTLKVTGYNSCISTITKTIDVKLPPVADFSLTSICHKDTALAIDLSAAQNGSITSWTWSLDNVPFSSAQNATLSPIATTNYVVKLTVKNNYTCKDSLTKSFTVYPLPAVDFTTSSPYYYPNTPVIFYPTNIGGISYDWNIDNTLYPIFSPTVSFASTGTYTAHLSMKNTFGCINTKTKILSVVNYFFDLAVLAVRANKSNDNYITVEADIGNVGSAKVSNFEIYYQIADAAKVKEEWQGNLNPGGFLTYTFNSNALQKSTEEAFITCVNLGLVNGSNDFNLNNNFLCSPSDLSEITVYEPYPNPSEEFTTLSIILPADMEINLDVVDELGQGVYMNKIVSGKQGLNLVTIPMSDLSKATYLVKITIGDKVFVKKLLKAKR